MRCLCAACCAALASCAATAAAAPAPPPKPPDTVDGEYRGTSTRFQADSRACPHPGLVDFEVIDSAFQFRWDRETWVDATIAPDGTITGGAERITLVGKQTGPTIEGDVTNGNCGLHFTVTKRFSNAADVVVNDRMQQGYRYECVAPIGAASIRVQPELTPRECCGSACSAANT